MADNEQIVYDDDFIEIIVRKKDVVIESIDIKYPVLKDKYYDFPSKHTKIKLDYSELENLEVDWTYVIIPAIGSSVFIAGLVFCYSSGLLKM